MLNIKLKIVQFTSGGDFLVLIERNVIKVMNLELVSNYQIKLKIWKLDQKINVCVPTTIAKQGGLRSTAKSKQKYKKASLFSGINWLGNVVESQCQQQYFDIHTINKAKFTQGEQCVYFTDVNVQFYEVTTQYLIWKILISAILVGVIGIGVCLQS